MLDKDLFCSAKNITDVYAISRKLKSEGQDVAEVNRLATIRKRELVVSSNKVNSLTRIIPKNGSLNKYKISNFSVVIDNLCSGKVILTRDGKVIL